MGPCRCRSQPAHVLKALPHLPGYAPSQVLLKLTYKKPATFWTNIDHFSYILCALYILQMNQTKALQTLDNRLVLELTNFFFLLSVKVFA